MTRCEGPFQCEYYDMISPAASWNIGVDGLSVAVGSWGWMWGVSEL